MNSLSTHTALNETTFVQHDMSSRKRGVNNFQLSSSLITTLALTPLDNSTFPLFLLTFDLYTSNILYRKRNFRILSLICLLSTFISATRRSRCTMSGRSTFLSLFDSFEHALFLLLFQNTCLIFTIIKIKNDTLL